MPRKANRWSERVTASPRAVTAALKRSADCSHLRKDTPLQSAISMLNFYINRAVKSLSAARKRMLNAAKPELRRLYAR